jgi:hypothetical protein
MFVNPPESSRIPKSICGFCITPPPFPPVWRNHWSHCISTLVSLSLITVSTIVNFKRSFDMRNWISDSDMILQEPQYGECKGQKNKKFYFLNTIAIKAAKILLLTKLSVSELISISVKLGSLCYTWRQGEISVSFLGVLTAKLLTTEFPSEVQCHLVTLFWNNACSVFGQMKVRLQRSVGTVMCRKLNRTLRILWRKPSCKKLKKISNNIGFVEVAVWSFRYFQ